MKKTLLSIGSLATIGAPIGAIVACAPENKKPKPPILPPFSENEDKTLLTLNYVDNINELSFSQARDLSHEIKRYQTILNIKFKNATNINIKQFKQDLKAYIDSDPQPYKWDLENAFSYLDGLDAPMLPYLPSEAIKRNQITSNNFWEKLLDIDLVKKRAEIQFDQEGVFLDDRLEDIVDDIKYKNLKISNPDDDNGTLDVSFDLTYKTGTLTYTRTFNNFVKSKNKDKQDIKDLNYLEIPTSLTTTKVDDFHDVIGLNPNNFQRKFGLSLDLDNDPKFKGMKVTDVKFTNRESSIMKGQTYEKNIKYGTKQVRSVDKGIKYVFTDPNGFAEISVTFVKGSATETVKLYIIGWAK